MTYLIKIIQTEVTFAKRKLLLQNGSYICYLPLIQYKWCQAGKM